jgi:protein TonB
MLDKGDTPRSSLDGKFLATDDVLPMEDSVPELYTARDIARAAGVAEPQVRSLLESGAIRSVAGFLGKRSDPAWSGFVLQGEAVRAVRSLRRQSLLAAPAADHLSLLLNSSAAPRRSAPFIVSTSLHAVVGVLLFIGSLGLTSAAEKTEPIDNNAQPVRLVFLAQPGPGGGGGGGGLKMKPPPPKAQRKGPQQVSSPIPIRRPPPPLEPIRKPVEPPPVPLEAKTLPVVTAPVAPVAADKKDQEGLLKEVPKELPPSQGTGTGGGTGSGQGTGIGEGSGSGIGAGEGGGTGGGPYRPGSGVTPPRLIKEVRADYTDAARRQNISGQVELEIVVRSDGSVGDVRILRRLGSGLDERAVQAVRQWRFSPARLKGAPVDVIVEVSVEFKLR